MLLAWCSYDNNMIKIIEVESKQEYATFDGVQLKDNSNFFYTFEISTVDSWTHVKEISNSKLLISVHHAWKKSASMKLFDISRKEQVREIYFLEEVFGSK